MDKVIVLKYIGGGAYVTGYPACDLSEADIAASGFSVDQFLALPGLFERVTQTPIVAFGSHDEDNEVSNG